MFFGRLARVGQGGFCWRPHLQGTQKIIYYGRNRILAALWLDPLLPYGPCQTASSHWQAGNKDW